MKFANFAGLRFVRQARSLGVDVYLAETVTYGRFGSMGSTRRRNEKYCENLPDVPSPGIRRSYADKQQYVTCDNNYGFCKKTRPVDSRRMY